MRKDRMNMIVKMMMGTMVMLSLSAIPVYAQEPGVGEMTTVNSEQKSTLLPPGVGTSRDVKHSTVRGSVISTAILELSNEGNGDIGILIETLTHVPCDRLLLSCPRCTSGKRQWQDRKSGFTDRGCINYQKIKI